MNKPSDEHYCAKHKCPKVWMITTSFCPACDKENIPTGCGTVSHSNTSFEFEPVDFDLTIPDFKIIKSVQEQWEAKYGKFKLLCGCSFVWPHTETSLTSSLRMLSTEISNLTVLGYPKTWPSAKWHDSIAKVWPV